VKTQLRWLLLIFGLSGLVGNVSASSLLTCSFNGGAYTTSGCYSIAGFAFNDSLDWQDAYGTADYVANPNQTYDPIANGPWAAVTSGGLGVSSTLAYDYTPLAHSLSRVDNFQMLYQSGAWNFAAYSGASYALYSGSFSSASTPGDPPGDHLLYSKHDQGRLELDFLSGISGILFRVSTPQVGDLNATVRAYDVEHPTSSDIPIMTYSILATNASGSCGGLIQTPPVPCDVAPYIGVQGLNGALRSIIITTTDTSGLLIDTLFLDAAASETPEPGTMGLFGVAAMALIFKRNRRKRLER